MYVKSRHLINTGMGISDFLRAAKPKAMYKCFIPNDNGFYPANFYQYFYACYAMNVYYGYFCVPPPIMLPNVITNTQSIFSYILRTFSQNMYKINQLSPGTTNSTSFQLNLE